MARYKVGYEFSGWSSMVIDADSEEDALKKLNLLAGSDDPECYGDPVSSVFEDIELEQSTAFAELVE